MLKLPPSRTRSTPWSCDDGPQLPLNVVETVLAAMQACGMDKPSPAWWATFRTIDAGSWGSRGSVLSILNLLNSGVFTQDRIAAIRRALA